MCNLGTLWVPFFLFFFLRHSVKKACWLLAVPPLHTDGWRHFHCAPTHTVTYPPPSRRKAIPAHDSNRFPLRRSRCRPSKSLGVLWHRVTPPVSQMLRLGFMAKSLTGASCVLKSPGGGGLFPSYETKAQLHTSVLFFFLKTR